MRIAGIPIFPGIILGKAFVYADTGGVKNAVEVDSLKDLSEKKSAIKHAINEAHRQIVATMSSFADKSSDAYAILDAHLTFLHDEAINEDILLSLEAGKCISDAINETFDAYIGILKNSENEFTQERAADMNDIRKRIFRCLSGRDEKSLRDITAPSIIVAKNLFPSDTVSLNKDMVLAILTEEGGLTSHTAILARSLGIPTILGASNATTLIKDGDLLGLNAQTGEIFIRPTEDEISMLEKKKEVFESVRKKSSAYKGRTAKTLDGTRIQIKLNISEADSILDEDVNASDGAGLMRSEFLYMRSKCLPNEEDQYNAYCEALKKFKGKPVTLRTLDIGGDKDLPALDLPREENPFLGCRAVRLCFNKPELFRTQLRAALRASAHGPLQLMFPMIGSLDDWLKAKTIVESVKKELEQEGKKFNCNIPLGIMIEIPSAALISDRLAKEVDFASVGTNDLCQYVNAADRLNPSVSQYYQVFSPAMFRLLRYVAKHYELSGTPVGICGEMGGDPRAAVVLVGLGFRSLSMSALSIGNVKQAVCRISLEEAKYLAQRACNANNQAEVMRFLEKYR